MAQYTPEEIGFLDETSKDEKTLGRRCGRSKKGRRAAKRQPFVRGRRTSTTGLLTLNGIEAATVVEGSMTKAMYLEFLEFTVVCLSLTSTYFISHHSSTVSKMQCISRATQRPCDG